MGGGSWPERLANREGINLRTLNFLRPLFQSQAEPHNYVVISGPSSVAKNWNSALSTTGSTKLGMDRSKTFLTISKKAAFQLFHSFLRNSCLSFMRGGGLDLKPQQSGSHGNGIGRRRRRGAWQPRASSYGLKKKRRLGEAKGERRPVSPGRSRQTRKQYFWDIWEPTVTHVDVM